MSPSRTALDTRDGRSGSPWAAQPVRVHYKTFGCKANQYDTERMRQSLEDGGAGAGAGAGVVGTNRIEAADVCVVNTCTVTSQADADARRFVRRVARLNPRAKVVVAGCSAVLRADDYRAMPEVSDLVEGHDPEAVRSAALGVLPRLVQLRRSAGRGTRGGSHSGRSAPLRRRAGATRGWLKVQDGCDRKCSFCATRLARGRSRSRTPEAVSAEAAELARVHPELVVTGVHIGHYGRDLDPRTTLAALVRRLLDEVPRARFRLGSIEATEIDDDLLDLLAESNGRLAPHLHMPLQSGADPVLRAMRRWHTRDQYRRRALEIADRIGPLGFGADVITGFPGETQADHDDTVRLVEELPFTYLHVFPWSPREGTAAAALPDRVTERISWERARELRTLAADKGARYAKSRGGSDVEVVLEGRGGSALTGDYLRVRAGSGRPADTRRLHTGRLSRDGARVTLVAAEAP